MENAKKIRLIVDRVLQGEFYLVTCKSGGDELYNKEHLAIDKDDAISISKEDYEPATKIQEAEIQWTAEKIT